MINILGSINNEFLREWIQISNWQTVFFLGLLVAAMTVTWKIGKETGSFSKMILTGVISAIVVGIIGGIMVNWDYSGMLEAAKDANGDWNYESNSYWVQEVFGRWFGGAWMWIRTLQLLITPTIFFAVIALIIKYGKDKKTKGVFLKSTAILLIGTGIAAVIGILVGLAFWNSLANLPWGEVSSDTTGNAGSLYDLLYSFFPNNLFAMFSNANSLIIPVILFAIVIGSFTVKMKSFGGEHAKAADGIESGVNSLDKLFKTILDYLIGLLPLVIIVLLSRAIVRTINIESLASIGMYLVAIYVALVIVYFLQLLVMAITTKSSILIAFKRTWKAMITGFTTQSSFGTLPVTIKTMKESGVSDTNAEIAPTLATTLGAHGCVGVFPALVVVAIAAGGGFDLTPTIVITTVIVIMFASLGIAGVPGVAGVAVAIVLGGIGQESSYALYAAILLPLGSLIDMGRTAVNVNGGMMTAVMIDAKDKTLDIKKWKGVETKAPVAKKVTAAKAPVKKTAVKKAPVKKVAVKKAPVKKTAVKKTTSKKK